jgi:pyruvate dehydrogenase E2 component (dihydrolipoamide acetyltransferase)
VRWKVAPGEAVHEDQPLVEVMTDKASVEIPSPRTGVVAALHAEEGQIVNVGATIISIDVEGDAPSHAAGHATGVRASAAGAAAPAVAAPAAVAGAARVHATPAVRQLAKQLGVALEALAGTGPGGAITADDVQRASASHGAPAKPPAPGAQAEERVPLRGLRRKIAEHMRHSLDTAAHYTFVAECDMTEVGAHRTSLATRAEAQAIKLTYLAYIVKALVASLREFPMLNASLDDAAGEIVIKRHYHVAIATHTPDGLTAPVIHHADRLSLFALAREIERLAQAARAGKLKLEELQGGTITVTSTGARGGVLATPILHHPQVAILGVHEIKPRPAVRDGQIVVRDLGNLSLSLDHRVVDGAVGADFLYDLIRRLEAPASWLGEQEIG